MGIHGAAYVALALVLGLSQSVLRLSAADWHGRLSQSRRWDSLWRHQQSATQWQDDDEQADQVEDVEQERQVGRSIQTVQTHPESAEFSQAGSESQGPNGEIWAADSKFEAVQQGPGTGRDPNFNPV